MSQERQGEAYTSGLERGGGSWPASRHAARLRRQARTRWRQLGFRRQFSVMLVAAASLSAVGTVALAVLWMPPVRPEAGLLMLIGLALTAVCLLAGFRLSGPVSRRAYDALTGGLDEIAASAVEMEALAAAQTTRSRQQALLARQLSDEVRALGETAERMEQGVALLRETAGQMWAEMSYPAAAVDAPLVEAPISARAARQAAVTASQLGAALEQTSALCYRLRARTNLVIAEASLLSAHGRDAERQLGALRAGVVRVEEALGYNGASAAAPGAGTGNRASQVERQAGEWLRWLGEMVARWGARRPARPLAFNGERSEPAPGGNAYAPATTSAVPGRAALAHGAGAPRSSSGRHPAAGSRAHPGISATRGRALSHPRGEGGAAGNNGERRGAFGQPPQRGPTTPRPGGDDWLNGSGGGR